MAAPDFKDIAARALAMADILLPDWLGGRRVGNEWHGERRANGGPGDSWCVNLTTGQWLHGSGTEKGGDFVALYAARHHIDQLPALIEVADLVGHADYPVKTLPLSAPAESLPDPIPEDAPDPPPHRQHGPATAVHHYGRAFLMTRYDLPDGSKSFAPLTWRHGRWQFKGYPDPKPIYGAELLHKHPEAPIWVVEGEKCADAARAILRAYVVVTWAGGSQAVKKSDWAPLKGRDVVIWPDADEPGAKAAATLAQILAPIAARVRVINPGDVPEGWDIADAIDEGWDAQKIVEWATERLKTTANGARAPEVIPNDERHEDYPADTAPRSALLAWQEMGLATDSKQVPHATLSNASMIMQFHPMLKGKIWWDNFCERIYHTTRGAAPQEWNDADSMRITTFIQQQLQLPRFTLKLVEDAVKHAAWANEKNSVTDWLDSLGWDGNERLGTWVGDCLGVELTAYSMAVGRNWILSMIARAYVPGCQVDTMPVLEGLQGQGKSSALEIIGGAWYAAVGTAFGSYDFIQTIQGKWLIEIPDMAGFSRREHSHVIATITTRTDRYRVKYGRFDQDHPRKCIFAATSESDDYLAELRGHRRYWPLRCGDIDLNSLRQQREQIFAEAVNAYKRGATFHDMPSDETAREQQARGTDDPWTEDVLAYAEPRGRMGQPVHPATILLDALGFTKRELDQTSKNRVVNILVAHDWHRKTIENSRQYVKRQRQ